MHTNKMHRELLSPILIIGIAVASIFFLYPVHISLSYMDTDFVDYCVGVSTLDDPARLFPPKRSKFAGLLPWLWGQSFGTLQGLALGAASSFIGCCLVIFYWAQILNNQAKWLALSVLLSMGPAISASRMLNFYPEITFFLLLGAFLVFRAIQKKTLGSFLLGGLGVAFCLLCDVRGLIWGFCYLPCLLITTLLCSGWKKKILYTSSVVLPVWLSWFVAWWSHHTHSSSLIRQADIRPLLYSVTSDSTWAPPHLLPNEFVWGYGNPLDIPSNLSFLWAQRAIPLPESLIGASSDYWWWWIGLISLTAMILLWREKKSWILLIVLVPFLLAYQSIGSLVEPHIRFYTQSLPAFAVLIGVGLASLIGRYTPLVIILCLIIPFLGGYFSPQWAVEREISTKMLRQAFPEEAGIKKMASQVGEIVHIQTLPVGNIERKIAHDWDHVCTETLREDGVWQLY